MRKLHRQNVTAPPILSAAAALAETKAAISFFSRKKIPAGQSFEYNIYRDKSVLEQLVAMSHSKCAYCEARAGEGADWQIEHFRPKKEIANPGLTPMKPGYYWLGANWDNLFPSCSHCNQWRQQYLQDGSRMGMGKKNQFPLSKGGKHVRSHRRDADITVKEEPFRLLLNPCIDSPEDHLQFNSDGIVSPAQQQDIVSEKGKASILIFALNRRELVMARREHAVGVECALSMIEDTLISYDQAVRAGDSIEAGRLKKEIDKAVVKLKQYTDTDKRFSALALCVVRSYLLRYAVEYNL